MSGDSGNLWEGVYTRTEEVVVGGVQEDDGYTETKG